VRRTRAAGPSTEPLHTPPARVWAAIEAQLDDRGAAAPPLRPWTPTRSASGARSPRSSRRAGAGLQAAAVVAALCVLAAGMWWGGGRPQAVTTVVLAPLAEGEAVNARLLATGDGLVVALDAVPDAGEGAYLELWLLAEDLSGLVSLGPARPGTHAPLPDGLDLAAFPVVDVSREPLDGDPAHSGDSLLRGRLPDDPFGGG
jgi:hypothetical protein